MSYSARHKSHPNYPLVKNLTYMTAILLMAIAVIFAITFLMVQARLVQPVNIPLPLGR